MNTNVKIEVNQNEKIKITASMDKAELVSLIEIVGEGEMVEIVITLNNTNALANSMVGWLQYKEKNDGPQ